MGLVHQKYKVAAVQADQRQAPACFMQRGVADDHGSQTGTIDIVDILQVENDLLDVLAHLLIQSFAQHGGSLTHNQSAFDIEDRDAFFLTPINFEHCSFSVPARAWAVPECLAEEYWKYRRER